MNGRPKERKSLEKYFKKLEKVRKYGNVWSGRNDQKGQNHKSR